MNGRHPRRHKNLIDSFKDAISGFILAFVQERNIHIQMFAAVAVIIFSILIHVSLIELMIVFLLIGGVISLELVNTAIERVVDLVTQERHPMAKAAKDAAAAAVWWFSVISVVVFIIIVVNTLIIN
ncbi:diacylglycerol kinase family protein [Sporolactobacillus shoreicorticis]|uniref:Diacylglycerol kinase family protein n=1 Tax=Sporolactobacillus shoreicorticis TaxID=1923877 RepID=A0ABW5S5F4_9BACL|nr:diacylglycerol kinase family protein [Sporolactobacillus shoreicorticis]MCO7126330.1 diacylglycerol kinase family protein [Sporolactobacillus shoreicorticis]